MLLERYAQAQFDLAISKGQGSSDLAEIAVGKIAVGLTEMWRVEGRGLYGPTGKKRSRTLRCEECGSGKIGNNGSD